MPADLDAFAALAARTGVKIVYDAAHAVGTLYQGHKVGPAGDMTVYSFQSNKNTSTLGEGGMVRTDNADYHARLQRAKSFGFQYGPVDNVLEWGSNYRMNKLQSAVGLTQPAKVDEVNRKRHENARLLSRLLADVPEIIAPFDDEAAGASRDAFLKLPREKYKVAVMIHYPPLWNFSFYRDQGYGMVGLPVASRVLRQLFNVLVHSRMTADDMAYVAWTIKQAVADVKRSA